MSNPHPLVFHLLPNAHLDPVWLWDWQEGLNEGVITVRTVLDLMDEFPELTFMRGESVIYEHIQKTDPASFKRIRGFIDSGRWDVVGGSAIQPDSNLACTEVLCREFERGLSYFAKELGVRPTVAWQADSFGHTGGFPNIFSAFGMDAFSFTRPMQQDFPLDAPAFWWEGDFKNRILCYRQYWNAYCSERENVPEVLDATLAGAAQSDFTHVAVFFGLGNHGGGPSRRHMHEIADWRAKHPEVEVRFSTLHGFFADLRKEVAARPKSGVRTVHGEFGYCLRGCYSSVQKFKSLYRLGEAQVADAEITRSVIGAATDTTSPSLGEAWDALLFNAFHDVLPGSSIERAFDEQMQWVGLAMHRARETKFSAMNKLVAQIDTTVPPARAADVATDVPVILWNPLPSPFTGLAEAEIHLDWRPIWKFKDRPDEMPVVVYDHTGKPAPFQIIETEHTAMTDVPWRRRIVVPVEIPPLGWTSLRVGWREEPESTPPTQVCFAERNGTTLTIRNSEWSVAAADGTVSIQRGGSSFFSENRNLEVRVLEDPWGSWGGPNDEAALSQVRETWLLAQAEFTEQGPLRAKLWTRWQGKNSWLELTFTVAADTPDLKIAGRMLWNERSARVKLIFPCAGDMEYDMPGTKIARDVKGQVPAARWATRTTGGKTVGFASDVLSDFDATPDELRVTLARASRYGNSEKLSPTEKPWRPAADCGELKFQCALFAENTEPDRVADALLFAPVAMMAPPSPGPLARKASLGNLSPETMRLLSIEQTGPGKLRVRVQNRARAASEAVLTLGESTLPLGKLGPEQIKTYIAQKRKGESNWTIRTARFTAPRAASGKPAAIV